MGTRVRTITQKALIPAPPGDVYEAFVDARTHSAFTGAKAAGPARVGAKFTAYDGYIFGVHRALVKGKKIVQAWQTTEWPDGAEPSVVEFSFKPAKGGTEVRMVHANVPAAQAEAYRQGWIDYYWTPLTSYFQRR